MKERLSREYIPALIERAIQFHSRRGIRWWCDCSFCTAKKMGTFKIGHYRYISKAATSYSNEYPRLSPPYVLTEWERGTRWEIDDYWRRLVAKTREGERVKLRQQLSDLKKEI